MEKRLTASAIAHAKPDAKPYDVRFQDRIILRVQPSGVRTYYAQVARAKRIKIGPVGTITPAMAIASARKLAVDASTYGADALTAPRGMTLSKFLDDVYGPHVVDEHRRGQRTIDDLRANFAAFLTMKLDRIKIRELDAWLKKRRRDGVTPSTIARNANQLQGALRFAVERGYIPASPFDTWQAPAVPRGSVERYLNADEYAAIRRAVADRDKLLSRERASANKWRRERGYPVLPMVADHVMPMVLLLMNTGARYGEIASLTWEAVSLERRTLTIPGEKSKAGRGRVIQLNDEAHRTLTTWRTVSGRSTGLVFQRDGQPIKSIKTAWDTVRRTSGVKDVRIHDLRHDFASGIVQRGGNLYVVQKLLGHSDIKLTMRYAHLADEQSANAVALLDGRGGGGAEIGRA